MKCFYPRNIRELGAGSAVIIYLLFSKQTVSEGATRDETFYGDGFNFNIRRRRKLRNLFISFKAKATLQPNNSNSYGDVSTAHTQDMLQIFQGLIQGKNIVILSKYNLKKGKPAGVKSLIGLFYISFSLSEFRCKKCASIRQNK